MRMTSTLKSFLLFLLGMGVLVTLIFILIFYLPGLGTVLLIGVMAIAGMFVLYVSFSPLIFYLSERADSILEVYADQGNHGLHIFSSFSVSRWKLFLPPVRAIQYYFVTDSGKLYYKVLFKHDMQPVAGQAGYTHFSSIEKEVLKGSELKKAIEEFSGKAGFSLTLGNQVHPGEAKDYTTHIANHNYRICKKEGLINEAYQLICTEIQTGKVLWRRKL